MKSSICLYKTSKRSSTYVTVSSQACNFFIKGVFFIGKTSASFRLFGNSFSSVEELIILVKIGR